MHDEAQKTGNHSHDGHSHGHDVTQHDPEAACAYAGQALELLGTAWYATGMDRVLEVRKALQPHAELDCVQRLDDRLYGWQATLSTLQR